MNGDELHAGDYVADGLLGDRYRVMGLNVSDDLAYADIDSGDDADAVKAYCRCLKLDERPHDCDGVPIEVGDELYHADSDGRPFGLPLEAVECIDETFFVKGYFEPMAPSRLTHREPDSFESIARDSLLDEYSYCEERGIGYCDDDNLAEHSMHADLVRRMKAVTARGWQR